MRSTFGVKDFVLMVMIFIVGGIVVLRGVQADRQWEQTKQYNGKLTAFEGQLARVEQATREAREDAAALRAEVKGIQQKLDEVKASLGGAAKPAAMRGVDALMEALVVRLAVEQVTALGTAGADRTVHAPSGLEDSATSPAGGGGGEEDAAAAAAVQPGDDWARPGVEVVRFPEWPFKSDPKSKPGYKEGGTFTEYFEARPAKVTPYIQTDVYGRRAVDLCMESLGAYDCETLRLRGLLAEAWQYDPKGMWLRVKIREKARWSDGTPVTAEDLRYAFHDYVMNPQIEAQRSRSTLADKIDKIEVLSTQVAEITFKEAMFDNLDSGLTLWPLPKHIYSKYTPAQINAMPGLMVGSGPFRMRDLEWTPDKPLVLERNEQYWGPRPPLAEMRFDTINDEQPRLVAYRNGECDMITPAATQYVTLKAEEKFARENQILNWLNMKSSRSAIIWNCGLRNGKPTPFTDARTRRAMTMLLNRQKMIDDIWKGVGTVCGQFVNPGSVGHDEKLKPLAYDPRGAKKLLKEAGWEDRNGDGQLEDKDGNPFVFEFVTFAGGEISQRISLFVQDTYAAAGIKAVPRQMDWAVGDNVRKQRDFDAMLMAWGANAPESDPKQIFHSNSIKDQGDNFAQWANPACDAAIESIRKELDVEKRIKHWHEFAKVMHEDQPYTWIRVAPYLRFVKPEIGNVHTYPKGLEPWEYYRGGAAAGGVAQ